MNKKEMREQLEKEIANDPIVKKIKLFNYSLMTGGGIALVLIENPLFINAFGFGMALLGFIKFLGMLDREREAENE